MHGIGCASSSLTAQEERDLVDIDVSAFPHLLQEAYTYAVESAAGRMDDGGMAEASARVQMAMMPSSFLLLLTGLSIACERLSKRPCLHPCMARKGARG